MLRNVLVQAAYQLAITLYLVYAGADDFGIDDAYLLEHGFSTSVTKYLGTFIFNTFVMCQVPHPPQPACSFTSNQLSPCLTVHAP
jgi:hypothetical protein